MYYIHYHYRDNRYGINTWHVHSRTASYDTAIRILENVTGMLGDIAEVRMYYEEEN